MHNKILIRFIITFLITTFSGRFQNIRTQDNRNTENERIEQKAISDTIIQKPNCFIFISNQNKEIDQSKFVEEFCETDIAYCFFLIQDFQKDSSGRVDLCMDLKFIDPQDSILFEQNNYAQGNIFVDEKYKNVLLDKSYNHLFTDDNQPGMYVIEAIVTDRISSVKNQTYSKLYYFNSSESKDIIMEPITDGKQLDVLWDEYFRTKNPLAIHRIISALYYKTKFPSAEWPIGMAADWSLRSLAENNPEIIAICERSMRYSNEPVKEILRDIINEVKQK